MVISPVWRSLTLFPLFASILAGAAKKTVAMGGENEDVILTVTIYTDAASVKRRWRRTGRQTHIVAKVTLAPKYRKRSRSIGTISAAYR